MITDKDGEGNENTHMISKNTSHYMHDLWVVLRIAFCGVLIQILGMWQENDYIKILLTHATYAMLVWILGSLWITKFVRQRYTILAILFAHYVHFLYLPMIIWDYPFEAHWVLSLLHLTSTALGCASVVKPPCSVNMVLFKYVIIVVCSHCLSTSLMHHLFLIDPTSPSSLI